MELLYRMNSSKVNHFFSISFQEQDAMFVLITTMVIQKLLMEYVNNVIVAIMLMYRDLEIVIHSLANV